MRSAISVRRSKLARACRSSGSLRSSEARIGEDALAGLGVGLGAALGDRGHLEVQAAEALEHARRRRARVDRGAQRADLLAQLGPRATVERGWRGLLAEHPMEPHDVGRKLVSRFAVGAGIRADVEDREGQLRVTEDDVVDPRGHATGHERVGPLDEQADVRRLSAHRGAPSASTPARGSAPGPPSPRPSRRVPRPPARCRSAGAR